jgi:deoxyribonuclease V
VVWDADSAGVVDTRVAHAPCRFPYVPGLLSFRELPAVLRALRMLRTVPDVVLCDAQGRAHPRRLGLASHLGLWLPMPTVGCAKSRLCGEHEEPEAARGAHTPLLDRGELVGVVLRTRVGVKPAYISVGNSIDLPSAVRVVLSATTRYRLPEPARLAHQLVTRERKALA